MQSNHLICHEVSDCRKEISKKTIILNQSAAAVKNLQVSPEKERPAIKAEY